MSRGSHKSLESQKLVYRALDNLSLDAVHAVMSYLEKSQTSIPKWGASKGSRRLNKWMLIIVYFLQVSFFLDVTI